MQNIHHRSLDRLVNFAVYQILAGVFSDQILPSGHVCPFPKTVMQRATDQIFGA